MQMLVCAVCLCVCVFVCTIQICCAIYRCTVCNHHPHPPLPPCPSKGSRAPVPRPGAQLNGHAHISSSPLDSPILSHASSVLSHAPSIDLPQTRKMIVLLDYSSDDPHCLAIKRGESVQVVRYEGDMALVRNERGREGLVPKANLFAPYSNRKIRGSIGSKASLFCESDSEPPPAPPRPLPMFHVASGGSMVSHGSGQGKFRGQDSEQPTSPPAPLEVSPDSNGASSSSEQQKHSPSSSSGVASSLSSHHTSHQVHNGASVQEQRSSFSSLEDDVLVTSSVQPHLQRNHTSPLASTGDKKTTNTSSDETISRGTNSNSPSLSAGGSAKHRPLPPPPSVAPSLQVARSDSPRNSSNSRPPVREGEQTPPPVPPRDVFVTKVPGLREGDYSSPADALHPNASHVERLAHYQRERGRENGRVRSATMQRTKPYNRQVTTSSGNFDGEYMPPMVSDVPPSRHSQSRRRFSEDQEASREKVYTDSSTPASSVNGDVFVASQGKVSKFKKCLWGLFVVIADFAACDENEISVSKGEHVSVWNRDDPDWFWVVRHTTGNEEGFVPSHCLHEMAATDAKHAASKCVNVLVGLCKVKVSPATGVLICLGLETTLSVICLSFYG